jgi:PAS domain S-box-containing protein
MKTSAMPAAGSIAAIVESAGDAILSTDLGGRILTWNVAAERMFGYAADEVIDRPMSLIVPADCLAGEAAALARIAAGEAARTYETWRLTRSGTRLQLSVTLSPVSDRRGRIIGASQIARDVSRRRTLEEALAAAEAGQRDLEQRLVALVAASATLFGSPKLDDVLPTILVLAKALVPADAYAVWRFDAAAGRWRIGVSFGISTSFSEAIAGSYGGGPASPVPFTDPLVVQSVEDVPMLAERLDAYRAERIESMLAAPLTIGGRGDGTLAFYYRARRTFSEVEILTARALGNLSGAAIATAELYEQQRRLREEAERANRQAVFLAETGAALASSLDYEATLQTVAHLAVPQIADWCAVDLIDDDGRVRRLAVVHVDPEKVEMARSLQERFDDGGTAPGSIARVIRTATSFLMPEMTDEMLARAARSEEHLRTLREVGIKSYIAVPLVAHGRTLGALTFVSKVAWRRYTPADLRFAEDVAYRSALAVENARAYRAANAANRAKDEFLATVSHELRTPLNAVLGWARMLRSGAVAEAKVPHALNVIERNAAAQLELVEDLLDLSRIITGKFRLDAQPVSLSPAIIAAVEAVQPAATAKGITIHVECVERHDIVLGDAARLQQVVWNLLSNAIKFTPAGGRVEVAVRARDRHLEVSVADTGEGIEAEVLPHVFDRFRQGSGGTTRLHTGLGLGLAIVRHIIELHGGRVSAVSEGTGRGSTFTLALPAIGADQLGRAG